MADERDSWRALGKACSHVAIATLLFLAIAVPAVGIDLLVVQLPKIGVTPGVVKLLGFGAYVLLGVDLLLFICFVFRTGWLLLKSL